MCFLNFFKIVQNFLTLEVFRIFIVALKVMKSFFFNPYRFFTTTFSVIFLISTIKKENKRKYLFQLSLKTSQVL